MRLDHPNVCPILGVGDTEQLPIYLVMPYLTGETLAVREMRRGPLSPGEGIPLLRQLCRGLDHAHGLQILHRDLKPENVILTPDPEAPDGVRAVLLDFGLAKVLREEPGLAPLTRAEMIIGTPDFMSPEQVRGDPLDARSDVYSLGLLAFEMFTGRLPFEGANDEELLIARLKVSPARLRALRAELPEALEQVIDRTLARSPTDRYRTAMELDAALAPLAQ
jgi:serine/threonine-protein kinase